ncbi:MAG: sugar ABC transporter permease [Clostridiales bacterium]|jgi:multiple sugar transport system permease protein|nr:sugar ABC transporter permease [Clostridiales bacterium]
MYTRKRRVLKENLIGYSFIFPNLAGVLLFTVIPVAATLVISFSDWDYTASLAQLNFTGLANYVNIWGDRWFVAALKNTLIYSACSVPLTIFFALVAALVVDRYVRAKKLVRLCLFLPYVTNLVVVCYAWQMMLSKNGVLTQAVRLLGVESPPIWLASSAWAMPTLIMIGAWLNVGYVFVLYQSALSGIPAELYESAVIDGANFLQQSLRITVPMLTPTTFFVLVTQLIFSFRMFDQVQILTDGGPGMATTVLAHYIYVSAFRYYKMGYASAMTWIMFIIIFLVTIIQWRGQRKWNVAL